MLLDTSGLLCFFDNSDSRHTDALTFFQSSATLLTHDCVLAEFVPLSYVRGFKRENTLRFVRSLINNPLVEIVWTTNYHYAQALPLLEARLDKTYSRRSFMMSTQTFCSTRRSSSKSCQRRPKRLTEAKCSSLTANICRP